MTHQRSLPLSGRSILRLNWSSSRLLSDLSPTVLTKAHHPNPNIFPLSHIFFHFIISAWDLSGFYPLPACSWKVISSKPSQHYSGSMTSLKYLLFEQNQQLFRTFMTWNCRFLWTLLFTAEFAQVIPRFYIFPRAGLEVGGTVELRWQRQMFISLFDSLSCCQSHTMMRAVWACLRCVCVCVSGRSAQKWMWVEKGVPGVSTCTVWQSEYPFLICPFVSCGLAHHTNAVWGFGVSCNSCHTPYCPVRGLVKAPCRPVTITHSEGRYAENIAINDTENHRTPPTEQTATAGISSSKTQWTGWTVFHFISQTELRIRKWISKCTD